jgi:hypothetical protein
MLSNGTAASRWANAGLIAVKALLALAFVCYWLTTICYVVPDNYLKVRAAPIMTVFETLFYQKWEFFAPPPTFNVKAYAVATLSEPPSTITLDLMSEVIKQKKERVPFNTAEDALDYVLFGSAVAINNNLREVYLDCKRTTSHSDQECLDLASTRLQEWDDSDRSVLALRNYALSALRRHAPLENVRSLRLRLSKVVTPKFATAMRQRDASPPQELTTYETKEFLIQK